jgi:hypothetical protein
MILRQISANTVSKVLFYHLVKKQYPLEEINAYCSKRDTYNSTISHIPQKIINDLNLSLNQFHPVFESMSSFSANMNLIEYSDIDIGILVKDLNSKEHILLSEIKQILITRGFTFIKTKHSHREDRYHCFEMKLEECIVEVKVRDHDSCKEIVKMHQFIDNELDTETKQILTFLKYKIHQNKEAYRSFKFLFYNSIMYYIPNGYILPL